MPFFTIQDFRTEFVSKGRGGYNKGTAVYTTDRGEQKEKGIMSFSNPGVYDTLKALTLPARVEVEYVKDDKYFNWAKVTPVTDAPATAPAAGSAPKTGTTKSTYETAEERAAKQVLIIKQSCLAQAVAYTSAAQKEIDATVDEVLDVAQQFVDWVMDDKQDLFDSPNDLPE